MDIIDKIFSRREFKDSPSHLESKAVDKTVTADW